MKPFTFFLCIPLFLLVSGTMGGCGGNGNDAGFDDSGTGAKESDVDTEHTSDSSDLNGKDTDKDTNEGTGFDGEDDTDSNKNIDTDTGEPICGEQGLNLALAGVNVMLLVDRSGSMLVDNRWNSSKDAISQFVTDPVHGDTWFGLHPFPGPPISSEFPFLQICEPYESPRVGLGPNTGSEIVDWMDKLINHPITGFSTPMLKAIRYYLGAFSTPLHDKTKSNYIVLLSDGADTCSWGWQPWSNPNLLAGMTDDLKDISGIKTIPIGLGSDVSERELNAIAKNGGSSFSEYIPATTADLALAFKKIAESIHPCTYLIAAPEQGWDSSKVNFYFDGTVVDRDRTHTDGWDWTKSDLLEVEFYGEKCDLIRSGSVIDVEATFGCPTQIGGEVCAEHDAYLPFPDSAVLVLMDISGSMGDGDKWEHASTALTNMLVDDRNNHIDFGFDPFPTGNSCDVSISPMFTVGDTLNHLPIIEWAAEQNPSRFFGSTPLLSVLKRLINRPGRIADKDISGSVIVISDGADTCHTPHGNVPTELFATVEQAVKLHDIRVFAIGFGDLDQDAEDQLNSVALAGNTGLSTFMKANDQTDLDNLFRQISSMVTSCVFDVPYAGTNVNYNDVNFYFDGVVVPRDTSETDGWNWVNDIKKDKVEFFGSYCNQLKSGNVVDVVIEFGCHTIVV